MSRTHVQIIDDVGVAAIAEGLGAPVETVRMWRYRGRIPYPRWTEFAEKFPAVSTRELMDGNPEVLRGARAN